MVKLNSRISQCLQLMSSVWLEMKDSHLASSQSNASSNGKPASNARKTSLRLVASLFLVKWCLTMILCLTSQFICIMEMLKSQINHRMLFKAPLLIQRASTLSRMFNLDITKWLLCTVKTNLSSQLSQPLLRQKLMGNLLLLNLSKSLDSQSKARS